MAAERLAAAGVRVAVYDAMPSPGRKFLRAGIGGLNLTHSEARPAFDAHYGARQAFVAHWLDALDGPGLRAWAAGLGITTFVGSSGRVFPVGMKAAPLLRAWLSRLRAAGVTLHPRHHWRGWTAGGTLAFDTPSGPVLARPAVTVLALGGGSWPQLGSDGAWVGLLQGAGATVVPLAPANCGFDVTPGWSEPLRAHAGAPLKHVALHWRLPDGSPQRRIGECVLTDTGLEGSLIYAASAALRDTLARDGHAQVMLDLLPGHSAQAVAAEVHRPHGSRSWSTHLKSRLKLSGVKAALLREVLGPLDEPARLAQAIKALPLMLVQPRPLAEAISSAGGVALEALTPDGMLHARPGVFAAGEMLDWEAPTGGYLLTAAMASGLMAGDGAVRWLAQGALRG